MDTIADLLARKQPKEPPQVVALKEYVRSNHGVEISVRVNTSHYLILVPTAALAHRLRVETFKIIETCELDKKLVIHIGYQ